MKEKNLLSSQQLNFNLQYTKDKVGSVKISTFLTGEIKNIEIIPDYRLFRSLSKSVAHYQQGNQVCHIISKDMIRQHVITEYLSYREKVSTEMELKVHAERILNKYKFEVCNTENIRSGDGHNNEASGQLIYTLKPLVERDELTGHLKWPLFVTLNNQASISIFGCRFHPVPPAELLTTSIEDYANNFEDTCILYQVTKKKACTPCFSFYFKVNNQIVKNENHENLILTIDNNIETITPLEIKRFKYSLRTKIEGYIEEYKNVPTTKKIYSSLMSFVKGDDAFRNLAWQIPDINTCPLYLASAKNMPTDFPNKHDAILLLLGTWSFSAKNKENKPIYNCLANLMFLSEGQIIKNSFGNNFYIPFSFSLVITPKEIDELSRLLHSHKIHLKPLSRKLLPEIANKISEVLHTMSPQLLFQSKEELMNFYFNLNYDMSLDNNKVHSLLAMQTDRQHKQRVLSKLSHARKYFTDAYNKYLTFPQINNGSLKRQRDENENDDLDESPTKKARLV